MTFGSPGTTSKRHLCERRTVHRTEVVWCDGRKKSKSTDYFSPITVNTESGASDRVRHSVRIVSTTQQIIVFPKTLLRDSANKTHVRCSKNSKLTKRARSHNMNFKLGLRPDDKHVTRGSSYMRYVYKRLCIVSKRETRTQLARDVSGLVNVTRGSFDVFKSFDVGD